MVSICDFTSKHIPLKYNCPYYCRVRVYLWMKVESFQSALARLIWDIQFHFKIQLIKVQKDLTIELIYAILPSPWISLRRHHKTLPMALWCLCKLIHHGWMCHGMNMSPIIMLRTNSRPMMPFPFSNNPRTICLLL